jgi:hypothetical protein
MWEAEIRGIVVPSQSRQKDQKTPYQWEKSYAWWYTPVIPVKYGEV